MKKPEKSATTVTIGIPSRDALTPLEMVLAISMQAFPANTGVGWSVITGMPVDEARNTIVEDALAQGAKYIWMVDDDTVPPMDAARKLMYVLEQSELNGTKAMVATGIYTQRTEPAFPLIFQGANEGPFWKWKKDQVFPVWGCGGGCLMVRTEVFKHLEKPYFETVQEPGHIEGEDIHFCRKVGEAGYRILAHGGVLCKHVDMRTGKAFELPPDSYPMTKEVAP